MSYDEECVRCKNDNPNVNVDYAVCDECHGVEVEGEEPPHPVCIMCLNEVENWGDLCEKCEDSLLN